MPLAVLQRDGAAVRPVLMLHRLTQQPGLLPPCSPALPLLPLTPVHLLVHANRMSTNPYMDLHSPSPSPVDTIDSVSSIETDDSAVTLSDTAPDDEHDFACIYLAHWPAQSPSADSDAWWRPLRLHEARHHNYLIEMCELYHIAADEIMLAERATGHSMCCGVCHLGHRHCWDDFRLAVPTAVSRYRQLFAAVDEQLGEINPEECYCPPICFTSATDRHAWASLPCRLQHRPFSTPAVYCGLRTLPLATTFALQRAESSESDEEAEMLFAVEAHGSGILCHAPVPRQRCG